MELESSQWCLWRDKRPRALTDTQKFRGTITNTVLPHGWSEPGTESSWGLHPWRYSNADGTRSWAAGRAQGGAVGLGGAQQSLPTSSTLGFGRTRRYLPCTSFIPKLVLSRVRGWGSKVGGGQMFHYTAQNHPVANGAVPLCCRVGRRPPAAQTPG